MFYLIHFSLSIVTVSNKQKTIICSSCLGMSCYVCVCAAWLSMVKWSPVISPFVVLISGYFVPFLPLPLRSPLHHVLVVSMSHKKGIHARTNNSFYIHIIVSSLVVWSSFTVAWFFPRDIVGHFCWDSSLNHFLIILALWEQSNC